MIATDKPTIHDAAELQNVLTRYIDSCEGYSQAAEVMESPDAASAFLEIAARRKDIVAKVADLILRLGEKPDRSSSPEATVHRWWIRIRAELTDEEFRATLEECIRGEKELRRTLDDAIESGCLESANSQLLKEISQELHAAIQTFETALGR